MKSFQTEPVPMSTGAELQQDPSIPPSTALEEDDGSVVIDFNAPGLGVGAQVPHDANLVDFMEHNELDKLANDLIPAFEQDRSSRKDWEKQYVAGLKQLGLKYEDRTKPWNGASGVYHPMLAEAVVRFQAQTIQEIFPATGPAKTKVVGETTQEVIAQSHRAEDYLNYLMTEEMEEYRNETEKLLFSLPIAGSAFRKIYYDPDKGRPAALFIPAEDYVVSYGAADLATCQRATHIMKRTPNQVRKLQVSGFYSDFDLPAPSKDIEETQREKDGLVGESANFEVDDRHTLLEMQVDLDLPGFEHQIEGVLTGIELPYVITIDKSSNKVLGLKRNWREDDDKMAPRQHVVHYQYIPGLGFYGFGLIHLIGGLVRSSTSILRQLVDSGTLANLPGGLKSRGLRIKGDSSPIMPGEFRDADVPMGAIRDNIAFLPYKEPSSVLYQLLGDLVEEGRRFASAADIAAADINGEAPVGTTLAIIEREMKVVSAVQARIHASQGKELKLLVKLVKDHGPDAYPYNVGGDFSITKDFDDRIDVIPVSDPNAGTMAQRIMQYQAALQLAGTAPQQYDMPFLHRQMLDVLGVHEVDKVIPDQDDFDPLDPISENMAIINGKPVRAFLYQDHEAHIAAHMSVMESPKLQAMIAQHPNAKGLMGIMSAHIAEHVAFQYRYEVEQQLGVELPPPGESLPEDIELRISRLAAKASAQVTGKAKQLAEAEQNAEQQKDPIIQQQERELDIKEQKIISDKELGLAKVAKDAAKEYKDYLIEKERMERKSAEEAAKLAVTLQGQESKANTEGIKQTVQVIDKIIDRASQNRGTE